MKILYSLVNKWKQKHFKKKGWGSFMIKWASCIILICRKLICSGLPIEYLLIQQGGLNSALYFDEGVLYRITRIFLGSSNTLKWLPQVFITKVFWVWNVSSQSYDYLSLFHPQRQYDPVWDVIKSSSSYSTITWWFVEKWKS